MKYYRILMLSLVLLQTIPSAAQNQGQLKNYPLLTGLETTKDLRKVLENDSLLVQLIPSLQSDPVESLKFSKAGIAQAGQRLKAHHLSSPEKFDKLIKYLKNGAYNSFADLSPQDLLLKAWQLEAEGINHTIAVYAQAKKPNYPRSDSISFNLADPKDRLTISEAARRVFEQNKNEKLFFSLQLNAAIAYLELNGRSDAGNYEPMEKTVNRLAVKQIRHIDWTKFPYTLILVPGIGPEDGVPLDPLGKQHCDLAIEQYKKGLAPFIMVSGGKVHPYKTKHCEAEEMKKYLVSMGIHESAIIMEPHARHTTTNLRNASRLIYKYSIPAEKPAVVITDPEQSAAISRMEKRCLQELGYVPYKLGNRLSDTMQEFYAVQKANQINHTEPLDP